MRNMIYNGRFDLSVEDRPEPTPGAGDILIQVDAVGICGSDVHGYAGETGRRKPGMTMGHEVRGIVLDCGAAVTSFYGGETVTVNPVIGCGRCDHCAAGATNLCAARTIIGVDSVYRGGFAERMTAPALNALTVHDGVAAELAEPLAVAVHAVRRAQVLAGEPVAVIGAGMIGLCCAWAAVRDGAGPVVISDIDPGKLVVAERLGFHAVDARTVALGDAFRELGMMEPRRVIDATGLSTTISAALSTVSRGGIIGLVGMGTRQLDVSAFDLVTAERSVIGSFCYSTAHFEEALAALTRTEATPARQLVDRVITLEEAPAAFKAIATGEISSVKTIVNPQA